MSASPLNINLILSPRQSGWPFWLASTVLHAVPLGILSLYEGQFSPGPVQPLAVDMVFIAADSPAQSDRKRTKNQVSTVNPAPALNQTPVLKQAPRISGPATELSDISAYADNPIPEYPEAARTQAIEGKVILALTVTPHGHICQIKPCPPQAHPLLENAVIATVKKWRFKTRGLTGEQTLVQEFCFKLTDSH